MFVNPTAAIGETTPRPASPRPSPGHTAASFARRARRAASRASSGRADTCAIRNVVSPSPCASTRPITDSTPPASADSSAAPKTWDGASQQLAAANNFTSPAPSMRKRVERYPEREADRSTSRSARDAPTGGGQHHDAEHDSEQRHQQHELVRNASTANVRDARNRRDPRGSTLRRATTVPMPRTKRPETRSSCRVIHGDVAAHSDNREHEGKVRAARTWPPRLRQTWRRRPWQRQRIPACPARVEIGPQRQRRGPNPVSRSADRVDLRVELAVQRAQRAVQLRQHEDGDAGDDDDDDAVLGGRGAVSRSGRRNGRNGSASTWWCPQG